MRPYASEAIPIIGFFDTVLETNCHLTESKIYVIENNKSGNLLGIKSCQNLKLITFNEKSSESFINEIKVEQNLETDSLQKLLKQFEDLFEGQGKLSDFEAILHVDKNITPAYQARYKYLYHLRKAINCELKRLESLDIIEKTNGPQNWVSNIVATPKTNGNVRLCLDARKINTAIIRDTFPLPTLDSLVDEMLGVKPFSKIDLKEAYQQIVLQKDCRNITSFHTDRGIYRFKRLCYGINNSFEIFQKAITEKIGDIENVKFLSDDIIIYTENRKEHLLTIETLFKRLHKLCLKINLSKCEFFKTKITYFGVELSAKGISADPNKIIALQNAKAPQNINELRSFLGLCNYVSKFIPNYSEKTAILRELLKKESKFSWTQGQENAFTNLKYHMTNDVVLKFYNPNKYVELHTDACDRSIGAALFQEDENNCKRLITYISRALFDRQQKYRPSEKEALSLVWIIEKLNLYLYGKHFDVFVDHKPLKFIFNANSKLSAKIFRWQLQLQRYNFTVHYTKGVEHVADFVSHIRKSNTNKNESDDTKEDAYVNFITQMAVPKTLSLQQIREESLVDNELKELRQTIQSRSWNTPFTKMFKNISLEFTENDGIVLRGHRIYIPQTLRKSVCDTVHQGHLGISKTKTVLRQKVYWPKMDNFIEEYINECVACAANTKVPTPQPITMSTLPEAPWTKISVDFFGPEIRKGKTIHRQS